MPNDDKAIAGLIAELPDSIGGQPGREVRAPIGRIFEYGYELPAGTHMEFSINTTQPGWMVRNVIANVSAPPNTDSEIGRDAGLIWAYWRWEHRIGLTWGHPTSVWCFNASASTIEDLELLLDAFAAASTSS